MTKRVALHHNTKFKRLGVIVGLVIVGVGVVKSGMFCSKASATCEQPSATSLVSEQVSTQITPQYFTFSQDKLNESLSEGKTVVLYFHAPWCTSCSTFDKELTDQPTDLPPEVIVLKIDFDSATELRNTYHVIYQHTLVLLNPDGTTKEMWIGGDLASLLEYLQNFR
jgi:thioredoxin 1